MTTSNDTFERPPEELDLKKALEHHRDSFGEAQVPVITISATYRKELADKFDVLLSHKGSDVVFSRAHYSMAEAVSRAAEEMELAHHMSDPTNFVSAKDWKKVEFTETIGQLMARYKLLKQLKDKIDTVARSKLPITEAVSKPLDYMTEKIKCPPISLHYEVGNLLCKLKKTVVQVVTDPHVRPQYLDALPSEKITYCVFDDETKKEFFKQAEKQNKQVDKDQVVVTGPPVDPRIARIGKSKKEFPKGRPLRLAITTGGLGTNLTEIKEALQQLTPLLKPEEKVQLFLYAGTHEDFRDFFEDYAKGENIRVGNLDEEDADIRILYEDSIIDANNNLIEHMFPWADGVMTKPSGDMAYDAAAAGCFMLFLEPWGPWEGNIQERFVKRNIGFDLEVWNTQEHFLDLWNSGKLANAMDNAHQLPEFFREGSFNIVGLQQTIPCEIG